MQVAFYLAGEITQVKESIPWVRCASGNVFSSIHLFKSSMWPFEVFYVPDVNGDIPPSLMVFFFTLVHKTLSELRA